MRKYVYTIMIMLFMILPLASCTDNDDLHKHSHEFGEWITVKAPSINEDGVEQRTCACGEKEIAIIQYNASTGLEFALNDDKQSYSVIGIGDCSDTQIRIPKEYNGLPVTGIAENAFYHNKILTSLIIPNSITSIGNSAFSHCDSLVYNEYDNAYYLGNDTNPYLILVQAKNTNISTCDINTNTKHFADEAFLDCANLTSIVIPDSITTISRALFSGCTNLNNVTIPSSITSIREDAFLNCRNLMYNEYGNAYYLGNNENPYFALVFAKNKNIIYCEINSNTQCFGDYAFYNCTNLTDVYISDLEKWCEFSFSDWSNPLSYGCNLYYNGELVTELKIPNGVTGIGKRAFSACQSITSVTIPNSVRSIDYGAFSGCENLTGIIIPNSVTSIESYAFDSCDNLSSVTLPNHITDIPECLFIDCQNLTKIIIPDTVTSIGDHAFHGCKNLESVTIPNSLQDIGWNAFNGCEKLKCIILPNSITNIDAEAFSHCTSLTSVIIPNGVTSIEEYAFGGCASLTSVIIPNSVTSIEEYAFSGCASLTSVIIPNSVTSIEEYAFGGCASLTSVIIPNSVTSIEEYAFDGCASLTSVTFQGTKAEWEAIYKGQGWSSSINVVYCTNGIAK